MESQSKMGSAFKKAPILRFVSPIVKDFHDYVLNTNNILRDSVKKPKCKTSLSKSSIIRIDDWNTNFECTQRRLGWKTWGGANQNQICQPYDFSDP